MLLYAPGWMQLIHLLVADILWIATILLVVFEAEERFVGLEQAPPPLGEASLKRPLRFLDGTEAKTSDCGHG